MRIDFHICTCGYSDSFFAEKIMVFAPQQTSTLCVDLAVLENGDTAKTKDLFEYVRAHRTAFDIPVSESEFALLSPQSVYYYYKEILWGVDDAKRLKEIFSDCLSSHIDAYCFLVAGASINHNNGYRFVVPSDERVHQFSEPHVHVKKGKDSPRYSLKTLERFPKDKFESHDYDRDKKIIAEGLAQNRETLMLFWKRATLGYIPPELDLEGKMYFKES